MCVGEYQDRRSGKKVDAHKTIWVLASNLGETILSWYYERKELSSRSDGQLLTMDVTELLKSLRATVIESMGVSHPFFFLK